VKPHHLESKLKALRLGGMMDTLEVRLAQAQAEQLGYVAFLELLLEDEIARRAQNALAVRVRKARFEEVKTLAEFVFAYNPKIPAATIRDLATCRFVERKESVILCGPVGVGKSPIAQALGYAACQKGFHVLYAKTGRLLQDLGGGHADGSWEARLRRYLAPDLLILDDFGIREFSPTQAEDLFELICDRHQAGSMIVASNRTPQDWYGLFPNPVLAEGALDRLVNSAHHVLMPGRSYRPLRRPDREATKLPLGSGVPSSPHTPPEHEGDQGLAEGGGGMP
jgi:DNA replication protein DnaC